jgi:hypothetical protein
LGSKVSPDGSEYAHDISLRLDDITIESQDGVIASNVRKLCGISIVDTSIQFVRYSIYLSSNNLLSNSQTDHFLRWTLKNEVFWIVEELLRLKVPTVEILASNLLVSAVRINKIDTVRAILASGVEINAFAGLNPPQTGGRQPLKKHSMNVLVSSLFKSSST